MKEYIRDRVLEIAKYILETGATVRGAATVFRYSKSTVHKDMSERLPEIDGGLARQVMKIMGKNKAERHIRGGQATRSKYRAMSLEAGAEGRRFIRSKTKRPSGSRG